MADNENLPDLLRRRLTRRRKTFRVVLASLGATVGAAIAIFFFMARASGSGVGARVLYCVAGPDDADWLIDQRLPVAGQADAEQASFRIFHQAGTELQSGPGYSGTAVSAARIADDRLAVTTSSRLLTFKRESAAWSLVETSNLGLNDANAWPVIAVHEKTRWLFWLRGKSVLLRPADKPDAEPVPMFETPSPATRLHAVTAAGAVWLTVLEGRSGQLTLLATRPSLTGDGQARVEVVRKSGHPGTLSRSSLAVFGNEVHTAVPVVASMRKEDSSRTWTVSAWVAGNTAEGEWVTLPAPPRAGAAGSLELTSFLTLLAKDDTLHAWFSDAGKVRHSSAKWKGAAEVSWSEPETVALDSSDGLNAMLWGAILFGLALVMTSQFVWLVLNRERPQDRAITNLLLKSEGRKPSTRPENKLVFASGPARAMALLIDLAMTSPVVILLQGLYGYRWEDAYGFIVLVSMGSLEAGLLQVIGASLVTLCVLVMYSLFCEMMWGRTLGKALFRLRVVDMEGEHPAPWRLVLRNLLKVVEMIHWTVLILPMALMLFTGKQQRLGDLAAGTLVVVDVIPDESPDDIDI